PFFAQDTFVTTFYLGEIPCLSLPDRTVGILHPVDKDVFLEAAGVDRLHVDYVAGTRQTKRFEILSFSFGNGYAAKKLTPRNQVGTRRIVKLVLPKNDFNNFRCRVLDFDSIEVTIQGLGFWSACFRDTLFDRFAAAIEGIAVWVSHALRIVNSGIAREVAVLRNHCTSRRGAFGGRCINGATRTRPFEVRNCQW